MAIFGLDVGEKRVGVAELDPETRIVKAVGVLEAAGAAEALATLAKKQGENEDVLIVVGMPMNQRGEETAQSEKVRSFARRLKGLLPTNAKISTFGESGTTKMALERLRERGYDDVKIREARASGLVDTEAACIILEGWAEENL